jgi:hypothetical protein
MRFPMLTVVLSAAALMTVMLMLAALGHALLAILVAFLAILGLAFDIDRRDRQARKLRGKSP